uniref:Uncharacterized protein n=1 Tax=Aegilops tauschii TaxID=37682 RepID=M8ARY9_AEGTA
METPTNGVHAGSLGRRISAGRLHLHLLLHDLRSRTPEVIACYECVLFDPTGTSYCSRMMLRDVKMFCLSGSREGPNLCNLKFQKYGSSPYRVQELTNVVRSGRCMEFQLDWVATGVHETPEQHGRLLAHLLTSLTFVMSHP